MDKIKTFLTSAWSSVPVIWIIFGIACVEVLSFAGWHFPDINAFGFIFFTVLTFVVSSKRLIYGVWLVFIELCIGSKGYLLSIPAGSFEVSVRLGMFLALFLAAVVWIVRERKITFFSWTFWKPYTALIGIVALGALIGVLRNNEIKHIFLDANGFFYLGLVIPLTQAIRSEADLKQTFGVLFSATFAMILKTIDLLFFFSHRGFFGDVWIPVYKWVRDTGVGEVTWYPNGFVRVFFQSHIYVVFLFFVMLLLGVYLFREKMTLKEIVKERSLRWTAVFFVLVTSVVFMSYSRSFWAGTLGALIILFAWLLFKLRMPWKRWVSAGLFVSLSAAAGIALTFLIVNIPLKGTQGVSGSALVTDRTENLGTEDAAASRWQLIQPLWNASLQHPMLGSGFGSTLTYISSDPTNRINNPSGLYTTFAFEWGYLDFFYKTGIVGFAIYAWLLITLFQQGIQTARRSSEHQPLIAGLLFALLAMIGVHVFTPYFNHPLGIGWILIVSLAISILSPGAKSQRV